MFAASKNMGMFSETVLEESSNCFSVSSRAARLADIQLTITSSSNTPNVIGSAVTMMRFCKLVAIGEVSKDLVSTQYFDLFTFSISQNNPPKINSIPMIAA